MNNNTKRRLRLVSDADTPETEGFETWQAHWTKRLTDAGVTSEQLALLAEMLNEVIDFYAEQVR